MRVRLKRNAPHVPLHHQGDVAEIVEERTFSFGRRWLRLRFEDGCEVWAPAERVEEAERREEES